MSVRESDVLSQDGDPTQESQVSDENATSSISEALDVTQLAETLLSDPRFEKLVQKHSNKEVSNLAKDQQSKLDRIEELVEGGMNIKDARERIRIEDALSFYEQMQGGATNNVSETLEETVTDNASDLDYVAALRDNNIDPTSISKDMRDKLLNFEGSQTQLKNFVFQNVSSFEASGASAAGPQGKSPPPPGLQELTNSYIQKYTDALNGGDKTLALQIKNEAIAKGVPWENITWEVR